MNDSKVEDSHNSQIDARYVFARIVKEVKKKVPSNCTFLSPIMSSNGVRSIRAIIDGNSYNIPVRQELDFTVEDIKFVEEQLTKICNSVNNA